MKPSIHIPDMGKLTIIDEASRMTNITKVLALSLETLPYEHTGSLRRNKHSNQNYNCGKVSKDHVAMRNVYVGGGGMYNEKTRTDLAN